MSLITLYATENGISRLLNQPRTIRPIINACTDEAGNGAFVHKALFREYVADLKAVFPLVVDWWSRTVEAQQSLGLDWDEAINAAFTNRLAGAASHPAFVKIIRDYWLQCAKENNNLEPDARLPQETFLLQWLIDAGEDELVRLLACMPYWPVGLDEDGNWC